MLGRSLDAYACEGGDRAGTAERTADGKLPLDEPNAWITCLVGDKGWVMFIALLIDSCNTGTFSTTIDSATTLELAKAMPWPRLMLLERDRGGGSVCNEE